VSPDSGIQEAAERRPLYPIGYQFYAPAVDAFRSIRVDVGRGGVDDRAAPGDFP
jgi:hypothetical protein